MPKRAVRIQPELDQRMQNATKERGYRSPSAFIRAAIESELKSRSERAGMEEQTAASFDRLAKEFRRVLRGQQAIFALLDAFTKVFLGWTTLLASLTIMLAHAVAVYIFGDAKDWSPDKDIFRSGHIIDFGLLFLFQGMFILVRR